MEPTWAGLRTSRRPAVRPLLRGLRGFPCPPRAPWPSRKGPLDSESSDHWRRTLQEIGTLAQPPLQLAPKLAPYLVRRVRLLCQNRAQTLSLPSALTGPRFRWAFRNQTFSMPDRVPRPQERERGREAPGVKGGHRLAEEVEVEARPEARLGALPRTDARARAANLGSPADRSAPPHRAKAEWVGRPPVVSAYRARSLSEKCRTSASEASSIPLGRRFRRCRLPKRSENGCVEG
jgi:hypothetical protein